jgi:PAS domain S-box-containing protein
MTDELTALRLEVETLRRRAALTDTMQQAFHVATWEHTAATGIVDCSDHARRLFGLSPENDVSLETFLAAVHPDDRDELAAVLETALGAAPETIAGLKHRVVHPTGEVLWLESRVVISLDGATGRRLVFGASVDRTEGFLAEQALRASEQTLRELGASLPALLWVREVPSGKLLYASPGWETYLAHRPAVGEDFRRLFEAVHPDDARTLRAAWEDVTNTAFDEVVRFLDPRGAVSWFRLRAIPIRNAKGEVYRVAGIGENITEQRAAAQALRDSEARYRSVVLAMTDGIVVHGPQGEIVTSNPSAERVLGLTEDQLAGRTSFDPRWRAIHEDGSPFPGEEHPGWVTLKTGQPLTGVIMGVHEPNGSLRWISINSRRVMSPDEEGAYSVVASFSDITERRLADERLRASLREKEVLLREIHHRVKNNLQIVSSLLYLQASKTEDPRVSHSFRESRNRIASMTLVHEMLYQSADLSSIPFASYVRDLGRSMYRSYGLEKAQIGFVVDVDDLMLPIDVAIPSGLLLTEILSNAMKHAFPGSRSGTIRVTLRGAEGERVHLQVSDDGVGLPDDFEIRRNGSLGSKLIERLIEQLDGTMSRSSSSAGTRYEMTFPLRPTTGTPDVTAPH